MDTKLLTQALTKFFLGVIIIGLLLFLSAGSFRYWQGWLLMGILFVPMFVAGFVLMAKNPELLRKRLNAKEKALKATPEELTLLTRTRIKRDSIRTQAETLGMKIRYIHKKQKEE